MFCVGKEIHRLNLIDPITACCQQREIAPLGLRITGDIDYPWWRKMQQRIQKCLACSRARRIKKDKVGMLSCFCHLGHQITRVRMQKPGIFDLASKKGDKSGASCV